MERLSRKMPIFASSVLCNWRHRGKLSSFEPLENLENSCVRVRSLKVVPPAVAYIQ